MTLEQLREKFSTAERSVQMLRGAIRLLRPDTLEKNVQHHFDQLSQTNEAIRRLPQLARQRIKADIERETREQRRSAAKAALYHVVGVGGVRNFIDDARETLMAIRSDVALSFPDDAVDTLSADGRVMLQLLKVQLRAALMQADVTTLQASYMAALKSQDAAGLVSAEIIEAIVADSTRPLAATDADLPIASQLRAAVDGVQELRLPTDHPTSPAIEALAAEALRLDALCELVQVLPSDPSVDRAAAAAFAKESAALLETGAIEQDDYLPASMTEAEGAEAAS